MCVCVLRNSNLFLFLRSSLFPETDHRHFQGDQNFATYGHAKLKNLEVPPKEFQYRLRIPYGMLHFAIQCNELEGKC